MLTRSLSVSTLAALIVLGTQSVALGAATDCADYGQFSTGCPTVGGSTTGDGAVLDGRLTLGGSPGSGGSSGGGASGGSSV
ncbi:hypothetical protein, partial [Microcella sp.]|uniref:hypothetical protein n=1 Tax=Microcella sp. TaxID=1913979 RepID=UPI00299F7EE8